MIFFEGNKYTDYFSESELLARVARSRQYVKAFAKEYYDPVFPVEASSVRSAIPNQPDPVMKEPDANLSSGGVVEEQQPSSVSMLDHQGSGVPLRGDRRTEEDVDHSGAVLDQGVPDVSRQGGIDVCGRLHSPLASCGTVAIVDFMNLFMRAWHAGQPSDVHAVRSMLDTIGNLIDRICPEFLVFAMDGGCVHRRGLLTSYKDRPAKSRELLAQIALAEEVLVAIDWPSIRVIGWEADDVMASLAVQFDQVAISTVLVSCDKDILQVCATTRARVYHPWGQGLHFSESSCREKYGVGFNQINAFLSLRGDSTDGVPGVPGIGDKTAATLLNEHGNLDAVLAAAAAGQVKGKVGKNLVEHADAARLSRELVTLRTDLPVGTHWQRWSIDEPRAGWQDALRRMKLFASAQRLGQRLPAGVDHGSEPSHIDVEWFEIGFDTTAKEFISSEIASTIVEPAAATVSPASPMNPTVVATNDDVETWYPNLAACPLDATLLDKVRAVYRTGRDYFLDQQQIENAWRVDCVFHAAFDQGIGGQPFEINLTDYDASGRRQDPTPAKPTMKASEGTPARSGALF